MIKTVVIPKDNNLYLSIPNDYIGKELEILLYAKDELIEKTKAKKTLGYFNSILSEKDYQSLKKHTEETRKEWNRDI